MLQLHIVNLLIYHLCFFMTLIRDGEEEQNVHQIDIRFAADIDQEQRKAEGGFLTKDNFLLWAQDFSNTSKDPMGLMVLLRKLERRA